MAEFQIRLLGGFALSESGRAVSVSAKKACALLAFLALRPNVAHPRDKLAALLWEDVPENQARASLRQTLSVLRRACPAFDGALAATQEAVVFSPPPDATDVKRFEMAHAKGTAESRREACSLYVGDLLDGLHLKARLFEDWLAGERQRLREMALQALAGRLEYEITAGEREMAVQTALRLLTLDPYRENTHRAVMRLYAQTGRPTLALRQYARCRDLLRDELGVLPEPETEALYREIRDQRRRPANEGTATVAEPAVEPAAEPARPELRQVALLVAEPVFAEGRRDPEDDHDAIVRFRDAVGEIAKRYRGSWRRHGAAGALVAFGARRTRGNECLRAVEAARALHQTADGARARIGVSCGLVLVPSVVCEADELSIMGEAVAAAEVLARAAEPGTTRIGEAVRAVLTPPSGHWRSPFSGREAECRQFEMLAERCRAAGTASIIYIRGEAGIGKSRLGDHFRVAAAGLGYGFHTGLFLDFGAERGGGGIRMLTRSLVGADASSGSDDLAADLDRAVADGLIAERDRHFLEVVLNLPSSVETRHLLDAMDSGARYAGARDAVVALIRSRCADAPQFLLLEDFHWADREASRFLAAVLEKLADRPLLAVLTARSDEDPVDRAWRAAIREIPLVTMDLTPLRAEEARALAAGYAVGEARREACVARAGGNPFFLEQLLANPQETEEGVPDSVRSVILARLDRLDGADRAALQAAAVLGQRFAAAAVRYLLDDPDRDFQGPAEHALVRADGEEMTFDHALVRDAIYGGLLKSRRRALHRKAADWYAGRDPILHAQHLECAADASAAAAYLAAARAVAAQHRLERALGLAETALRLAVGSEVAGPAALFAGALLQDLGRLDESRRMLARVLAMDSRRTERCRALISLAAAHRLEDRVDEALASLGEAEPLVDDGADRARMHLLRANLMFARGEIAACAEEHARALEEARACGSPELEVHALGGLGDGCYANGRMRQALRHFEDCVARARQHGFPRVEAVHLPMVATTRLFCLRREEAEADLAAAVRLAQRIGDLRAELLAELVATEIARDGRDPAPIEARLPRLFTLAERIGSRRFLSEALMFEASAHRLRGDEARARARLLASLAICRESGMGYLGPQVLAALALGEADARERTRLLAEGEALLHAGSIGHNHLCFYRDAIQVSLDDRRWDNAESYAVKLRAFGADADGPIPWADLHADRGEVMAARGRGKADPAALRRIHARLVDAGMERLAHEVARLF